MATSATEYDGLEPLDVLLDEESFILYRPSIGLPDHLLSDLEASLAACCEHGEPPPDELASGTGRRQWFAELSPLGWLGPRRWHRASWRLDGEAQLEPIHIVRRAVEEAAKSVEHATATAWRLRETFNTVLVNRYSTGADCIKWHADDERWYYVGASKDNTDIVIASVSLGAERVFEFRSDPRSVPKAQRRCVRLRLRSGSLLVMAGATQKNYQHALPRDDDCTSVRYKCARTGLEPLLGGSALPACLSPPAPCSAAFGRLPRPQLDLSARALARRGPPTAHRGGGGGGGRRRQRPRRRRW